VAILRLFKCCNYSRESCSRLFKDARDFISHLRNVFSFDDFVFLLSQYFCVTFCLIKVTWN